MHQHVAPEVVASVISESLPYIQQFAGKVIVIKIGGTPMTDMDTLNQVAKDIVLLKTIGICPIVVHGGGGEVSQLTESLGNKAQFIDGMRVTDEATMKIVEMVLAGHINGRVVDAINNAGGQAIGLRGRDANLFTTTALDTATDYGRVGQIKEVNTDYLLTSCRQSYIPVIAPIGVDWQDKKPRNINADWVACSLAAALPAYRLLLLSDIDGLQNAEGKVLSQVSRQEMIELRNSNAVSGGMISKLDALDQCLGQGVASAHIINGTLKHAILLELLTNAGIGTIIGNEEY